METEKKTIKDKKYDDKLKWVDKKNTITGKR